MLQTSPINTNIGEILCNITNTILRRVFLKNNGKKDSILRTSEKSRPFGYQMLLHYIRGCVSIIELELMKYATEDKSILRARTYDVLVQFVRKLNVILKQQRTSTWRKSATSSSVSRSRSVWTFTRARYRNITHECLERNIEIIKYH